MQNVEIYYRLRLSTNNGASQDETLLFEWVMRIGDDTVAHTLVGEAEVQEWVGQLQGPCNLVEFRNVRLIMDATVRRQIAEYLELVLEGAKDVERDGPRYPPHGLGFGI